MEEEKSEKCKHNPMNGWIKYNVESRLHWIKTTNPNIYRVYDENGGSAWVCDQAYQKKIDEARKKGLKVELQNNLDEIRSLEASVKRLEGLVKEHEENCKGYVFKRLEDGTVGYFRVK